MTTATTDLAPVRRSGQELARPDDFGRAKVELLKRTVCKGASDDELELFIHACKRTGLDPFMRQIHAVKRWDDGKPVMAIQTGIDGYRLIADRTRKYMPGREPVYVYDEQNRLISATAYVLKMGPDSKWHEISATAFFEEYAGRKKDGSPNSMWATKPHVMTAKCAEALALRKAFPNDLSGLYTDEEMQQADNPPQPVAPALPPANSDEPDLAIDADFFFVWDAAIEGKGLDPATGRKLLGAILKKRGIRLESADVATRQQLIDELSAKAPADLEKFRQAADPGRADQTASSTEGVRDNPGQPAPSSAPDVSGADAEPPPLEPELWNEFVENAWQLAREQLSSDIMPSDRKTFDSALKAELVTIGHVGKETQTSPEWRRDVIDRIRKARGVWAYLAGNGGNRA